MDGRVNTRGITFASEEQRRSYLADCRADRLKEQPRMASDMASVMKHDTRLVGQAFYLAPELKAYRLSKDGSCVTSELVVRM